MFLIRNHWSILTCLFCFRSVPVPCQKVCFLALQSIQNKINFVRSRSSTNSAWHVCNSNFSIYFCFSFFFWLDLVPFSISWHKMLNCRWESHRGDSDVRLRALDLFFHVNLHWFRIEMLRPMGFKILQGQDYPFSFSWWYSPCPGRAPCAAPGFQHANQQKHCNYLNTTGYFSGAYIGTIQ